MANQWLRDYRLLVTSDADANQVVDLSEFRVVFHVSQSLLRKPCTAEITVYNVSRSTANLISLPLNSTSEPKHRSKVIIEAGYKGSRGTIFNGELWWKSMGRESQTDTFMRLIASIGDSAWNYAVVNTSIPKGGTQEQIFSEISKSLHNHEVPTNGTPKGLVQTALPRGKVIFQPTRDLMNKFSDTNNLNYGFGADGLITAPSGDTYDEFETVHVVNATTGMIGRPTLSADGVTVQMLLNPKIEVGSIIQIDNRSVQRGSYNTDISDMNFTATDDMLDSDGYYRVVSREHQGDTHGDAWYTTVICVGVHARLQTATTTILEMGSNG